MAGGDADLFVDEVDAGDRLGDRMLDLEPRIHLDEEELAVLVEELDRAGARVAELGDGVGDHPADPRPLLRADGRGGRFFPHLLVAPLQRAVALAEVDRIVPAVAEDLDLDVPRPAEVALHVERIVAEGGHRLGAGGGEGGRHLVGRAHHLHAAPAAAGLGLDEHGVADLGGNLAGRNLVRDGAFGTGHHGNPELLRGALGLDLVAHDADVLGARADEGDVVGLEDFGEAGILGQESVAGMDGFRAGDLAGGEKLRDVEVGIARRRRPDADALVREADMHGVAVGRRVHRDGGDPEFLAGAKDAERDLAAVGDQDLAEEGRRVIHSMIISGSPYSTGWPSSTMILVTLPERVDGIWFIVFIASTIRRVCPSRTVSPTSTKGFPPGSAAR